MIPCTQICAMAPSVVPVQSVTSKLFSTVQKHPFMAMTTIGIAGLACWWIASKIKSKSKYLINRLGGLEQQNAECPWYATYHALCLKKDFKPNPLVFRGAFAQSIKQHSGYYQDSKFIRNSLIHSMDLLVPLRGTAPRTEAINFHVFEDIEMELSCLENPFVNKFDREWKLTHPNYFPEDTAKERVPGFRSGKLSQSVRSFRVSQEPQVVILRTGGSLSQRSGESEVAYANRGNNVRSHWIAVKLYKKTGRICIDFYDSADWSDSMFKQDFDRLVRLFDTVDLKKLKPSNLRIA